ncbi:MAG: cupin domain-containing protein [Chloroflexi bacterium]|nr:cupin domain-containing protein [Chloroflexota bacterium]
MPVMRGPEDRPDWVRWSAVGVGIVDDADSFDRHFHDADEYWLIFEGRARVMTEGVEVEVGPGDIVCTRMGEEHDILEVIEGPLKSFYIEDELRGRKRAGHLHRRDDP